MKLNPPPVSFSATPAGYTAQEVASKWKSLALGAIDEANQQGTKYIVEWCSAAESAFEVTNISGLLSRINREISNLTSPLTSPTPEFSVQTKDSLRIEYIVTTAL
ncbi:hypothetical protein B5S32_g5286 [[Candida] boidinii]|nr:hypothetical protein B5S32_g5286 [[Candida] boidinii]